MRSEDIAADKARTVARDQLMRRAGVMAAAAKGHPVEFRNLSGGEWQATSSPDWNWKTQEYRTTQHGVRARCYDVTSEGRDSSRFTVDMTFCSIGGPGGAPHHWRGRTLRVIVEDDDA